MAVIETPKGRVIGLILPQGQPAAPAEPAKEAETKPAPKRVGRPAKK